MSDTYSKLYVKETVRQDHQQEDICLRKACNYGHLRACWYPQCDLLQMDGSRPLHGGFEDAGAVLRCTSKQIWASNIEAMLPSRQYAARDSTKRCCQGLLLRIEDTITADSS